MMPPGTIISLLVAGLAIVPPPLHAHRTQGLLQSALVDVQADRVGVQVTLLLGADISPMFASLMDVNGDGKISGEEKSDWSQSFLDRQTITVDGTPLPLSHASTQHSPLAEMAAAADGHAEVKIVFSGETSLLTPGPHTIVHQNRYEPITSTYQTHGIVPKDPGIRITSHSRGELERSITLEAEAGVPPSGALSLVTHPKQKLPASTSSCLACLAGIAAAGAFLIRRSARSGIPDAE